MIALDTDVFSLFLYGNELVMSKLQQRHHEPITLPVVVAEEVLRGRLNSIRTAQAGRQREQLLNAYGRLAFSINSIASFQILAYTADADSLCNEWKRQKIRVTTRDMRIAAICASQGVTLVTQNRRDFDLIPNLTLESWS